LLFGRRVDLHPSGGSRKKVTMSDIGVDPNAVINDLLEQVKQLTAANTVLRVNLNTAVERIQTLEQELVTAVSEDSSDGDSTLKKDD